MGVEICARSLDFLGSTERKMERMCSGLRQNKGESSGRTKVNHLGESEHEWSLVGV